MKDREFDIENLREVIMLSDSKVWGIVSQKKGVGKSYIAQKLLDYMKKAGKAVLYLGYGDNKDKSVSLEEEISRFISGRENGEIIKTTKISMSACPHIEKTIYDNNFEKLIESYKKRFDYVIIDMMSLEENSIAKRLCSLCDNNLFVINKDIQNGMELRKVIAQLHDVNVRIGGIVMNEYHKKKSWLRA